METLLKWLNKPKADDKSLLARFFHADRALAAVASELDSFDGRAEPDRCSRLVSRLRQGQDKVLAITNLIIEELLGDERDQRAFRAKFPEEVLQENLAGQLWFGAECLAAGSSIMNREQESKEMRPLAEAVTRSLNNVRYLLRDQCLRNNVPNSERLNLDKNDAATEQLYESLKRFDRLFAEFEWRYVSAMVQVKSKEEYEMQELICVLCSETLQRALKLGLLEQDKVDAFDPALMFSIPRLAIVSGLVIYPQGPLNMDMPAEQLSEMFRPFRSILIKVREYLRNLNETELYCLERLLCTNEEISLKDTLNSKDSTSAATPTIPSPDNNNPSSKYAENPQLTKNVDKEEGESGSIKTIKTTTTSKLPQKSSTSSSSCHKTYKTKPTRRADSPSPAPSTTSSSSDECSPYYTPVSSTPSSPRSSHSLVSTTSVGDDSNGTTSPDSWIDDEEEELVNDNQFLQKLDEEAHYADDDDSDLNDDEVVDNVGRDDRDHDREDLDNNLILDDVQERLVEQMINLEMAIADCATGFLISNTTLGSLLQPQEVPLTDNFVVSDSDLPTHDGDEDCNDNLDAEMPSTSAKALNSSKKGPERHQQQQQIDQENNENNNSATNASLSLHDPEEISISQQSSNNNPATASTTTTTSHTHRRRYSDQLNQQPAQTETCSKDHPRPTHRHHHRHHHHHHHHNHHHTTANTSTPTTRTTSTTASLENRLHRRHNLHHHHHPQRRSHRHGGHSGDSKSQLLPGDEFVTNGATKEDITIANSKAASSMGLDIETPSSSSSILEDNKSVARSVGRMKFKHTENLLHRLFVCIAGVADQLQTNFAFDLRQILRSVFLMNMSPAQEELEIPEKPKDNELFEFRASENDVIQESAGSSQSIYSAEEVNPEGDNQSNNSSSSSGGGSSSSSNDCNRAYRHSTGTSATTNETTTNTTTKTTSDSANHQQQRERQQIERSRSLDNDNSPPPPVDATPARIVQPTQAQRQLQRHHQHIFRNRHHSTGSNSPSLSSSENSSPVCERSSNASSRRVSESNANTTTTPPTTASSPVHLSPPAWIPDQKAPRCMSCNTPFTAFRRRHHCRNCGGVFCGVCSNTSAPLPKYGLTKAVRVCRACYMHELSPNALSAANNHHSQHQHHHPQHHSQLVSQTTVTNTTNNEPRRTLRRPVTTTRAID